MAEIFGAVAGGAGLMSLSIQLLESAQKLHGFYHSSKNAPEMLCELAEEMETMSLSLRHLEQHRQHDETIEDLLSRCIRSCQRKVARVSDLVGDMENRLSRFGRGGRLYAAFKEPEMKKLMVEMEQTKSSLSLAYLTYCQSWQVREAKRRELDSQEQVRSLEAQSEQLGFIHAELKAGNAAIKQQLAVVVLPNAALTASGRLETFANPQPPQSVAQTAVESFDVRNRTSSGARSVRRRWQARISLPRWLSNRMWDIAMSESEGCWNLLIQQVNVRYHESPAFTYVINGDTEAVKIMLKTGHLGVFDETENGFNIFEMALASRVPEVCQLLLRDSTRFRDENLLRKAFARRLYADGPGRFLESMIRHCIEDYKLDLSVNDFCKSTHDYDIHLITDDASALKYLILGSKKYFDMEQSGAGKDASPSPFVSDWPFPERFIYAMARQRKEMWANSLNWSALAFRECVRTDGRIRMVTQKDARGRTALHWIVRQLFASVGTDWRQQAEASSSRLVGYVSLITELLRLGADLLVRDNDGFTPFSAAMKNIWSVWSPCMTPAERSAMAAGAVELWGRAIVEAGTTVCEYAQKENLASGFPIARWSSLGFANVGTELFLNSLATSDESPVLLARFSKRLKISVYSHHPPPGALQSVQLLPLKICWEPNEDDEPHFWSPVGDVEFGSACFEADKITEISPVDSLEPREELLIGTQDDNSYVHIVAKQCETNQERDQFRRPRSLSQPPLVSRLHPPTNLAGLFFDRSTCHWMSGFHRCPLDLKWTMGCFDRTEGYLSCLKGRRNDWPFADSSRLHTWESQILECGLATETLVRHLRRFRPDHVAHSKAKREWRRQYDDMDALVEKERGRTK